MLKAIVGGVAAVARRLVLRYELRGAERRGVEALQGRPAAAFERAEGRHRNAAVAVLHDDQGVGVSSSCFVDPNPSMRSKAKLWWTRMRFALVSPEKPPTSVRAGFE